MEAEEKIKILSKRIDGQIEKTNEEKPKESESKIHNLNRELIDQMGAMKSVLEDTRKEKEEIMFKSEKESVMKCVIFLKHFNIFILLTK